MYEFESIDVAPEHLALDHENPRFFVSDVLTPTQIIDQLVANEDILSLARSISQNGLLPGERLIAIREGGEMVVVEGNRRLCAIKLLLDPTLVPTAFKNSFPKASAEVAESLTSIAVDLLPDRVAAEPIITRRHTASDVRSWGVLQKIRRTNRYWAKYKSLDLVASTLGETRGDVARDLREFALVHAALTLPKWSLAERARLNDIHLSANPFIRFASRQEVREALGLAFDAEFKIELSKPKAVTKKAIEHLARQFLLPGPNGEPPPKNTRADEAQELDAILTLFSDAERPAEKTDSSEKGGAEGDKSQDTTSEKKAGDDETGSAKSKKKDPFLDTLVIQIDDPAVHQIINELKKIRPNSRPLTSTFLVRSLVEATFSFHLSAKGLMPPNSKGGKGPSIGELVNKLIGHYQEFGLSKSDADILDSCRSQKLFDYLNWGVHSAVIPNSVEIKKISDRLRVILQKLLVK